MICAIVVDNVFVYVLFLLVAVGERCFSVGQVGVHGFLRKRLVGNPVCSLLDISFQNVFKSIM